MTTPISFMGWEPKHLSYSTVNGHRDCGMRTLLQKVHQIEQRPGLAALGGNAVHTATELYDLGLLRQMPGIPSAEDLFSHAWAENLADYQKRSPSYSVEEYVATGKAAQAYGGKQNLQWHLEHGPARVQAWIDWRHEYGWEVWTAPDGQPAIELDLRVDLPNGITMQMHVDRVMVTPTGHVVVLDLKTGRVPSSPEQLGLYATGVELKYGAEHRPEWGYYWHPDKGHGNPMDLTAYSVRHFNEVTALAAARMNAGEYPANPQFGCHNWCGVAHACPAVGGTPPEPLFA